MPKVVDEYLRRMSTLNMLFAISSVGLLAITVWMVYDDYSRSWKRHQTEFRRIEAGIVQTSLEAAQQAVDGPALEAARQDLEAARADTREHARGLEEAAAHLKQIETEHFRTDLQFREIKSTYDARKFEYEEKANEGHANAAELLTHVQELQRRLEELRTTLLENEKAGAEAADAVKAITGKADEAAKRLEVLNAEATRLQGRLDKVAPHGLMKAALAALNAPLMDFVAPTYKIQQVVLERVPIDINFTRIPRADRCQTCHLASDRTGFEDQPQPFRTHPRQDLFVGGGSPHPIDRLGCSPCHGGRDRAVDFVYATHTPDNATQRAEWKDRHDWERDHLWDFPMLATSRTEASCLKCHQGVVTVPQAPRLNRGLQIVERYGCFGCHKIRGFEDRDKVGPTLTRLAAKTNPEWVARWLSNPKEFRPSTRMPRFFGLRNNQEPGDAEREAAEIRGIIAYLRGRGEPFPTPPLPGRGDVRRGETLVKSIGCMGCHAIERDEAAAEVLQARNRLEGPDPIAWERRFGPDLSHVGSKLRPEWIYRWVMDPKSYDPKTRMPSLRLTVQEALDITDYLMTLRDEGAAATPPAANPVARDRTLLAYLSQRMTAKDAQAKLDTLSDGDRDVFLGEKSIQRYGCFGCHIIPGFEKTPPIGTELSEAGSKHPDLLFFGFIHEIEHTAPAWYFQKLKSPRIFDQGKVLAFYDRLRMPQFEFTDDQAEAVTLVLQGLTKEKVPLESVRRLSARDQAVEAMRRIVRDSNCHGCHILEGAGGAIRQSIASTMMAGGMSEDEAQATAPSLAPPILDGEGDKVQPEWLFHFFKAPSPIRPWLQVRMPSFGFSDAQTNLLVHGFAARDARSFPFQTLPTERPREAEMQAALTMFTGDYFNCWNCHQQGSRKPQGPPEGWAPDLTLAHERLNPDWIARWIENPQKLMPGTRMPTYYDPEDPKGSAPPDVLDGDPQRQIEALRDYVFTLGARGPSAPAGRSVRPRR